MTAELLVLVVGFTAMSGGLAQIEPEPADIGARFMEIARKERAREDGVNTIPGSVLAAQPEVALRELRLYEQDPSPRVRWQVYAHYWSLGVSTDRRDIRRAVTEKLLLATDDFAAERLLSFEEEDFGPRARILLRQMLAPDPKETTKDATTYWHLVLVAGIAQMREEIPHLGTFLFDELAPRANAGARMSYGRVGWAARLARARMGVEEDVARAIEVVEAESDPGYRVTSLLRRLGYIRHPAAFAAIAKYLESEERLPRVKDNVPGAEFAQYAMEVLAESVPDFPVPRKYLAYTQEDIQQARVWMDSRFKQGRD